MDAAEYEKGPAEVGQPGAQLPQGAAKQMAAADTSAPKDPLTPAPQPLEPMAANPPQPYEQNDQNKFLYGPTARPNEHITTGTGASGRPLPPKDVAQWADALRNLANDPTAPPAVRAIYNALLDAATRG